MRIVRSSFGTLALAAITASAVGQGPSDTRPISREQILGHVVLRQTYAVPGGGVGGWVFNDAVPPVNWGNQRNMKVSGNFVPLDGGAPASCKEFRVPSGIPGQDMLVLASKDPSLAFGALRVLTYEFDLVKAPWLITQSQRDDLSLDPFTEPTQGMVNALSSMQFRGAFDDTALTVDNQIVNWLHLNMRYSAVKTSSDHTLADALARRAGDCGDYSFGFQAAMRAAGIPTTTMYGELLQLSPRGLSYYAPHARCYRLCGKAWVPVDATMGGAYVGSGNEDAKGLFHIALHSYGMGRYRSYDMNWDKGELYQKDVSPTLLQVPTVFNTGGSATIAPCNGQIDPSQHWEVISFGPPQTTATNSENGNGQVKQ